MIEKNLVIKANELNESRYKLTIQEQRVVLSMISMIEPDDVDFKPYNIKIKDFIDLVGLKGGGTYSEIKKITKVLRGKTFTITKPTGVLQIGWVSSAEYFDNEGRVELCFDPKLKPYLLELKKDFTRYQLKNTIRLKSSYSIRIYELLKQYQRVGSRLFELGELRVVLGVPGGKLNTYSNFRIRVIDPALLELKNTDISFTYKPKKTKRKVTGITFSIFRNEENIKKSYKKSYHSFGEEKPKDKQVQTKKDVIQDELFKDDKSQKIGSAITANVEEIARFEATFELIKDGKMSKKQAMELHKNITAGEGFRFGRFLKKQL